MRTSIFFCLFITINFLSFSCQKSGTGHNGNRFTVEAKNWVSSNLKIAKSQLPSRVIRLSEKLDWSQASFYSAGQQEYAVVPLQKDELKLGNNYFIKRTFVFYKRANGAMEMQIVELLTKDQSATNPVQLAAALFERKTSSTSLPAQTQDVQAFFYDKQYRTVDAYEVRDNKWHLLHASCLSKPDEQLTKNFDGGSGECREWCVYVVTRDQYGNVIHEQLLYTYWVGDCGGGGTGDNPNEEPGEWLGGGEAQEYDLEAEAALFVEALSTKISPQEKTITYTSASVTGVTFQWIVVENQFGAWKVQSSDIAEGYNSSNTGAVLYKIQHQGSAISGLTQWGRIRRDGSQGVPLISLSWSESSNSSTIASDYRSGTVSVSGFLKNLGLGFPGNSHSNFCKIRLQ